MKKYFKYLLCLNLICASLACSDDFVDVKPADENSEDFFNSEKDYNDALLGAYDLLQSTYLNVMIGEIASNNTLAGGESATDVPGFQEIDDMTHTPVNAQLRDVWSWMYAGLNRANYVMEFQNKTDFTNKNVVLGEARFLRAYFSFELVKFFGDIPYSVDKRIQFGDQFTLDRTPKAQVYEQIELDLIFAAENLPLMATVKGRATKGAAQALLGKVYIFQDKFANAATELDKVINSGVYMLVTDYNSIFEHAGENNAESVFEVQYTDKEGAGFDCLQCSEGNVAVGFNGVRNYSGPLFESGFSFNVPTQNAFDAFEAGDMRKDVAILDIEAWKQSNSQLTPPVDVAYATGYEHTGYFNRKYIARVGDQNTGDQNLTNPNNYRAIRYADVLLLAAEANSRGNIDEAKARTYLNQVRSRAGLADVPSSTTGATLVDAIFKERRVELMGEGHHFFELVRTNRANDPIEGIPGFVVGKHEVFPIPSIEIELAGSRWAQNPNY